jgi:hypothetical protein
MIAVLYREYRIFYRSNGRKSGLNVEAKIYRPDNVVETYTMQELQDEQGIYYLDYPIRIGGNYLVVVRSSDGDVEEHKFVAVYQNPFASYES